MPWCILGDLLLDSLHPLDGQHGTSASDGVRYRGTARDLRQHHGVCRCIDQTTILIKIPDVPVEQGPERTGPTCAAGSSASEVAVPFGEGNRPASQKLREKETTS